jgi:hypothetical protein
MKFNPKVKFWKPRPNQKEEITILPKEGHQLLHDYFITNHKMENKDLGDRQENIRQVVDYENRPFFNYMEKERDYFVEPMPRFADYAKEIGGGWEVHDNTIRKITMPRIGWEQVRNTPTWKQWECKDYTLYHTKDFNRWRLAGHHGDTIGVLPYDTPKEEAFAWAEEHILHKDIRDVKTIEESGGNPNIMSEKELPVNVTLKRAKIVNEWVPKEINDYRTLANRCSGLWNCDLDVKGAEQLLEEVFIRLKEEGIKPNFFQHRS